MSQFDGKFLPSLGKLQIRPILTVTPTPLVLNQASGTDSSDVHSPDGTAKLIMQTKTLSNTVSYAFSVSDIEESNKQLIFSTDGKKGEFSFTPNAWSPDNAYFYTIKNQDNGVNGLVFRKTGEDFSGGQKYLDVLSVFTTKYPQYRITSITGWDSETLLHLRTVKDDGAKGPSFWFEIPSTAVLQLYN